MIQLDRISKQYSDRVLFTDLSWQLKPGQRIGLVGPNGAGKTTLFRILMGEVETDGGRVIVPKEATLGLLPQQLEELVDRPILDFALEGKPEVLDLEREMQELTDAVARASDPDEARQLTERLGVVQHAYEDGGGYHLRADANAILGGMGFKTDDLERSASELSGGWRMRLALAKLLLQRPDVLLMDEPTNHLDVPSLEWLEEFLQTYEGTLVVISHDRYFLDRLINQVAALEVDGFQTYAGNLTAYQVAREERIEMLKRQKVQQDKQIKETERFIERFRYKATKARQVQSRVKQLEKVERIVLPTGRKKVSFRFPEAPRSGQAVCSIESVAVRYGDLTVYNDLDYELIRGERVALVGPNGEGKSTLLKLLAGDLTPSAGSARLGHQVVMGYFAQHQVDGLDTSRSILEEMRAHATNESHAQCRSILGAFLFSKDDVDKRIAVLSGGERARVALAKLLLRPTNLLLLDEPTNHLDMVSRDVLVEALVAYHGSLVFVSHDRHFINALATRVVHVEGGECIDYPGDYDYYRFKRSQLGAETVEPGDGPAAAPKRTRKEERRLDAERRKVMGRRLNPLKASLGEVEADVARREAAVEALEEQMADPALYEDPVRSREVREQHGEHKSTLAGLYDQWMDLSHQIEEIEAEFGQP